MILKNPKLFVWIIAPRSVQGCTVLPAEPEILCVFHVSQTRAAYNPMSYLWLLKRFRFQFQQRNCTLGGHPSITCECTQKASGSGPWLNQVQGKPPCCDIQTSIQHKVVLVPFMTFMERQVQFIHFTVLWKQDPKWVILWYRTSAKNSQLVQADILRTCFSSIKISSDDLFLYNTGMKETLFSQRWLMACPQDKCSSLELLHQGCPLLPLHIFSRGL